MSDKRTFLYGVHAATVPLRVAIPLVLFATALVLGLVSWMYFSRMAAQNQEQQMQRESAAVAARLQRRLEILLAQNDVVEAQRTLQIFDIDPHVQVAWLADDQDRIIAATRRSLLDDLAATRYVEFAAPLPLTQVQSLLMRVRETRTGLSQVTGDGAALLTFYPVSWLSITGESRSSRTGILFLRNDLSQSKRDAIAPIVGQAILVTTVLFGAAGLVGFYLYVAVTRRIERLVAVAHALRQGDEQARTHFEGKDELSQIGVALDAMVDTLQARSAQAAAALQTSHQQLLAAITYAPLSIALFDRDMRYLATSQIWMREFARGYTDIIGRSHYEIHPDLPEAWKAIHQRGLAGETLKNDEDLWVQADGSEYWLRWAVVPWRDRQGEIGGIIISSENITDRKLTEREANASEQRFRNVLDTMQLIGVMLDRDGNIILCNDFFLARTGWTREEVLHRSWFDLFLPPEIRDAIKSDVFLEAIHNGNVPAYNENEIVTRTGDRRLVAWNNTVIRGRDGNVVSTASIGEDITERRRTEKSLRESEARFRSMADCSPVLIWVSGPDMLFTYVNRPWLTFTGRALEQALGMGWLESVHPDDRAQCQSAYRRAFEARAPFQTEYRLRRYDGQWRWLVDIGMPRSENGDLFLGYIGSCMDVTERKQAENLLSGEKDVLEMMAKAVSLSAILDMIARNVETLSSESLCSILLLDSDGVHVRHGAAPSLPKDYNDAIEGEPIGPKAGSCGTAMYRKEQVIVTDIATDPLWDDYRDVALSYGLRACWSTPIQAADGHVLGSFALYWREPRAPGPDDIDIIVRMTHLSAIAIERKRAERKLAESETLLRTIVDSEPACVKLIGPDGKLLEMNPAGLSMIEAPSREAVVGQSVAQLVAPEHRAAFERLQQQVLAGRPGVLEFDVVGLKGTRRTLETHAVPLRAPSGGIFAALGLTQDITERQRTARALKESEARYRAIFQGAGVSLWEEDFSGLYADVMALKREHGAGLGDWFDAHPDNLLALAQRVRVVDVNRASVALFGAKTKEDLLNSLAQVLVPESMPVFRDELVALAEGAPSFAAEAEVGTLNKGRLTVLLTLTVTEMAYPWERILVSILDVTEIKNYRTQLEEQVAQRTAQLQAAYKELESFSYSISHDLHAPLRSLLGFSAALQEEYGDQLDGAARDYLGRIQRGALRMSELIDALLQLSRVARGEMKHEPLDLSSMANQVIDTLRQADPQRSVEVSIAPGLTAVGDATLIHAAIENLLSNAWKYSSRTEHARIEFRQETHDAERVFCVADNGAGFDMKYSSRLFGPFQRLHTAAEFPGTGVGLATVERIVRRHGGRIWAEAEINKGARFYFTLASA